MKGISLELWDKAVELANEFAPLLEGKDADVVLMSFAMLTGFILSDENRTAAEREEAMGAQFSNIRTLVRMGAMPHSETLQ